MAENEAKTRSEQAMQYFLQGYNCSQSVVLAFSDLLTLDRETLCRMSCSFGGGMGRMRETCGAVSGMMLVAGLLYGYPDTGLGGEKTTHYARVQELARRFEEETGSLSCRRLLGIDRQHDDPTPTARTEDFYRKRPCKNLIGMSARILEDYLRTHPID